MLKKSFTQLLFLSFTLLSTVMLNANETANLKYEDSEEISDKSHHRSYAVFSNQASVEDGENIPWQSTPEQIFSNISVDESGNITLPKKGVFLIEYTVRIQKSPYDGTETAIVQLQQTVSGVPTNVGQAAVISNSSTDGLDNEEPSLETQITGYAIISVSSHNNNVINLAVSITDGSNISIPSASGTDANAQIVILQLK